MSIRDLFNKTDTVVVNKKSLSDLSSSFSLESAGVISSSFKEYDRLLPNVDFSKPETFVKYGSAELYYSQSITNICLNYPIDGSKKEKIIWRNNASYLDNYIFDHEYPKHTGSIVIGRTFGTASVTNAGFYSTPSNIEYIKIGPGLQTGTIYSATNRFSAFSFNSEDGFCIEFFMRADSWSNDLSTASLMCIFDMGARSEDITSSAVFSSQNALRYSVYTQIISSSLYNLGILNENGASIYTEYIENNAFLPNEWNHFAINVFSGGAVDFWKNGRKQNSISSGTSFWPSQPANLTFSGTIGAFSYIPASLYYNNFGVTLGWNKFSGALDDFRFWRRARTDKEITSNWFCSVDGGYGSDEELDPDMGFYYKFNEKTLNTASIDALVFDYSGRKNHGYWIGYSSGSRLEYSPMENEIPDIINHISSSEVQAVLTSSMFKGRSYDVNNNGSFINLAPSFLSDQDESKDFSKLTQILAAMFDRLWLQIDNLTSLKDSSYFQSGSLSSDLIIKAINSTGLEIPSIFENYTLKELIEQKTDEYAFESNIEKVRTTILKNIQANLIYLFKSKGTEKSLKSIFRAFGVDDEVLKIKAYSDNSIIEIDGTKRIDTVRRKNFLDLSGKNDLNNMNGVVFNQYISEETASYPFVTSSTNFDYQKTIETTIIFPKKEDEYNSNYTPFLNSNLSASLFGFYQIPESTSITSQDTTFKDGGYKLNVFAVQKNKQSKDAKFVMILSSSEINTIYRETDWISNVYDNSKWTISVRTFLSQTNKVNTFSSFAQSFITSSFNFLAINELSNNIIQTVSFSDVLQKVINPSLSQYHGKTKFYLGANRTNFTGTIINPTQAKFAYMRVWNVYLQDQDIINHALDGHNYGVFSSTWNWNSYSTKDPSYDLDMNFSPKMETLLFNWDFENNYTPNSLGIFTVSSLRGNSIYSGGVDSTVTQARKLIPIGPNYTAIGYGFNSGSIILDKNYLIEQKNRNPLDFYSYDDISLVDDNTKFFGRAIKPQQFYYTVENSPYAVLSEDMLNMFSDSGEFNNLYGHSTDYYRLDYKLMRTIRFLFFSKIQNTKIDFNKYFSYFKWIDDSITLLIKQLIPFSLNSDGEIKNIIESHVLEKNKYFWPSFKLKVKRELAIFSGSIVSNRKSYRPPS